MANDMQTTVVGNLCDDPELKFLENGSAVANFTVASTLRVYDKVKEEWADGETMFLRCHVWNVQAENLGDSLVKGSRVVAYGSLRQTRWESKNGEKHVTFEMNIDEIGASLKFRAVKIVTTQRVTAPEPKPEEEVAPPVKPAKKTRKAKTA